MIHFIYDLSLHEILKYEIDKKNYGIWNGYGVFVEFGLILFDPKSKDDKVLDLFSLKRVNNF